MNQPLDFNSRTNQRSAAQAAAAQPPVVQPSAVNTDAASKSKPGILHRMVVLSLMPITIFTFAALLGRMHWFLELTSHFRMQYLIAAVVATVLLLLLRRFRLAGFAGLLIAINAVFVLPVYFASAAVVPEDTETLRVLFSNVYVQNRQYEDVKKMVREFDPDIVLFAETHRRWIRRLDELKAEYPYVVSDPNSGAFGVAGFSRIKPDDMQIVWIGEPSVPMVVVKAKVGGKSITVIGAHVESPGDGQSLINRTQHMQQLAKLVNQQTSPTAVIGDLNVTPWSPYFGDFLAASDMRDTRAGFGNQHSWPAMPPHLSPLKIPIDHCLVTDDVVLSRREIGRFVGSDHYPLLVELSVAEGAMDEADEIDEAPEADEARQAGPVSGNHDQ